MTDRAELMKNRIDSYEWSVRTGTCLRHAGIVTVGDLVLRTERDLRGLPNFGQKSLAEVKEFLLERGLRLGLAPGDTGSIYSPGELERMKRLLKTGTAGLCLTSVRDHVTAALSLHRISHFNRGNTREHHIAVVEARMAEVEFIVRAWVREHGGEIP